MPNPASVILGVILGTATGVSVATPIPFAEIIDTFAILGPEAKRGTSAIMLNYGVLQPEVKLSMKDILQDYHQVTKEPSRPFADRLNGYDILEPRAKRSIDAIIHEYRILNHASQRSLDTLLRGMDAYDLPDDEMSRTHAAIMRAYDDLKLSNAGAGPRSAPDPTSFALSPTYLHTKSRADLLK